MVKTGMAPDEAADRVFEAIVQVRFYIFTHPEMHALIKSRMADIVPGRNPAPPIPTSPNRGNPKLKPVSINHAISSKPMNGIHIIEADLERVEHQHAILELTDAYARDPMGNGKPLSESVRWDLISGAVFVKTAWNLKSASHTRACRDVTFPDEWRQNARFVA